MPAPGSQGCGPFRRGSPGEQRRAALRPRCSPKGSFLAALTPQARLFRGVEGWNKEGKPGVRLAWRQGCTPSSIFPAGPVRFQQSSRFSLETSRGPGCGQGPCAAKRPGLSREGMARLRWKTSQVFHGGKPQTRPPLATIVNGAVAPTRVGVGGFGEGTRPGIGVAAKRGLKLLLVPAAPGKAGAGEGGGGTRAGNVGGLHPGSGALGLAPSRAAQLSPGGCGCVCVSVFVALAGTDGSRVRDGDKAQGRRDTGEELFCLSLVNKWEGGMCRC